MSREPQEIRFSANLLRTYLGLDEGSVVDDIIAAWPTLVTPSIAEVTVPLVLRNEVLTVAVHDSTIVSSLKWYDERICDFCRENMEISVQKVVWQT